MWLGQACFFMSLNVATSVIAVERFLKCKYNTFFVAVVAAAAVAAAVSIIYPIAFSYATIVVAAYVMYC